MKVVFGSDHAGFELRNQLVEHAKLIGVDTYEVGATSEEPYDYPDAADAACDVFADKNCDFGILICGTGIGMCIRANRHEGIRAANCCDERAATLARAHNHANFLCLGARLLDAEDAARIMQVFLKAPTDMDERHLKRIRKLDGNAVKV